MQFPPLQSGDILLYRPVAFHKNPLAWVFGTLVTLKTFSSFSHVEIYAGNGLSAASRDGKGVGLYPFRNTELGLVLRPTQKFDLKASVPWLKTVIGEKYDWKGLLRFDKLVPHGMPNRMFCSNFAYRYLRSGGVRLFGDGYDADLVYPGLFPAAKDTTQIWSDGK